jgi:hypothetical protein
MRATEIIRNVLDIIDDIEIGDEPQKTLSITAKADIPPGREVDDNVRRFKHILDLVSTAKDPDGVVNRPDVKVADIDAVTVDAGGGMHSPKQAMDIRSAHSAMFPFIQGIAKE